MCRCCIVIEVLVKIEIYMMVQQIRYKIDHGSLILQAINDTTMRVHDKYRKTIDIDPTLHTLMTTVQLLASFYLYFIIPGIESFPMHTNIYNLRAFSCHSCQNSIWHCTRCNNQEWYMHLIFSFQEEITIFEKNQQ